MPKLLALSVGLFVSFACVGISLDTLDSFILLFITAQLAVTISFYIICRSTKITSLIFIPITMIFISSSYVVSNWIQYATADHFSVTALIYFIIMLIFAIFANTVKQNTIFGIRTSFTLDYKPVWDRTHSLYSTVQCLFIPASFVIIFWSNGWIRFALANIFLLLPAIVATVYSTIIGIPFHKEAQNNQAEELLKQLKAEEEGKLK